MSRLCVRLLRGHLLPPIQARSARPLSLSAVPSPNRPPSRSVLRNVFDRLGIPLCKSAPELVAVTETELLQKIDFLKTIGFNEKELAWAALKKPSLLSMDIVGQLTPLLQRFQSLGVKPATLAVLLSNAPFIGFEVTESALDCRIQVLKDLDFSASQVQCIMRKLSKPKSFRRLLNFFKMPPKKLKSVMSIMQKLGLENARARVLATNFPSVFFCNDNSVASLEILLDDRRPDLQAEYLIIRLLGFNGKYLDVKQRVEFLTGLLEKDVLLPHLVERPHILFVQQQHLVAVADLLQGLGLDKKSALLLMMKRSYLVKAGPTRLGRRTDLFLQNGVDSKVILKLMEVNQRSFQATVSNLEAKIAFFKDKGFEGEALNRLLGSHPEVLGYKLERLSSVDFEKGVSSDLGPEIAETAPRTLGLEKGVSSDLGPEIAETAPRMLDLEKGVSSDLGPEIAETAQRMLGLEKGVSSDLGPETAETAPRIIHKGFQTRIDWLTNLGIPNEEVLAMVQKMPSIFAIGDARIQKKVDYLMNTMGYAAKELTSTPTFLHCSLRTKLEPRQRVISVLKSTGVIDSNPPLSIFVGPEDSFVKQFVEPYPQALDVYKSGNGSEN